MALAPVPAAQGRALAYGCGENEGCSGPGLGTARRSSGQAASPSGLTRQLPSEAAEYQTLRFKNSGFKRKGGGGQRASDS